MSSCRWLALVLCVLLSGVFPAAGYAAGEEALCEAAYAAFDEGNVYNALSLVAKAHQQSPPQSETAAMALVLWTEILMGQHQYDEARTRAEAFYALAPKNPRISPGDRKTNLLNLMQLAAIAENYSEALRYNGEAVAIVKAVHPGSTELDALSRQAAEYHEKSGNPDAAAASRQEAAKGPQPAIMTAHAAPVTDDDLIMLAVDAPAQNDLTQFAATWQAAEAAFAAGNRDEAVAGFTKTIALMDGQTSQYSAALQSRLADARKIDNATDYYNSLETPHWRWNEQTRDIWVYIYPGEWHPNWKPHYPEMMMRAFQAWEQDMNPRVRFVFTTNPDESDMMVDWLDAPPIGSDKGHKGYTRMRAYGSNMVENNIEIILDEPGLADPYIYHTMLHEVGHSLGITSHSTNPGDVMYPSFDRGKPPVVTISQRDHNTVRMLYASSVNYTNRPGQRLVRAMAAAVAEEKRPGLKIGRLKFSFF